MFGFKKKQTVNLRRDYDQKIVFQIDKAKIDWDSALLSEDALYDGGVNMRLIQAQTKLARAKYYYLYREARRRKATGHMQTHVMRSDF